MAAAMAEAAIDERAGRMHTALGLMSGTSLDGIDAAIIITDGVAILDSGPALTMPYPPAFREDLRGLLGRRPTAEDAAIIRALDAHHVAAVRALLAQPGVPAVDIIGYHGQTVWHRPAARETIQIGDGQVLADALGIPVVAQFRRADVAAGGEGAPFVPLYHRALAQPLARPLAVINIGGVANITWIGDDDAPRADDGGPAVLAFDTGPGNALIDDWLWRRLGIAFDEDGRIGAAGVVREDLIDHWLAHPYISLPAPKSLDRDAFAFALDDVAALSPADGTATLTALTAAAIAAGLTQVPTAPHRCLVAGGGRHNPLLMAMLGERTGIAVEPVEAVGWRGDALEAEAFAFLAVRSVRGLALSLPSTTGVDRPQTGGRLCRPRTGAGR